MEWTELLNDIFRLCIIPLLGVLVTYITKYINKKSKEVQEDIDSNIAKKYIDLLSEIVITCVIATKQTYVDSLKDKDAFDEKAQAEAFKMTYEAVMSLLTDDAKKVLQEVYTDLPLIIKELIEKSVNETKDITF